jgi:hypothetical protein
MTAEAPALSIRLLAMPAYLSNPVPDIVMAILDPTCKIY